MQALCYLTVRLWINGVRRAVQHPARLVLLVMFLALFGLPMLMSIGTSIGMREQPALPPGMVLPDDELLALGMVVHVVMFWMVLGSSHHTVPIISLSDVHFLFPSPLRRLRLLLFLLVTRGALSSVLTLLVLVVMLVGMGNQLIALTISGVKQWHPVVSLAYPALYLLAYLSLLIWKVLFLVHEARDERFRLRLRVISWSLVAVLAAVLGWQAYRARLAGEDMLEAIVWQVLYAPGLAVVLLPIRALPEAMFAFYMGWTPFVTAGFAVWGLALVAGLRGMVVHQQWLYEAGVRMATFAAQYQQQRTNPLLWVQSSLTRSGTPSERTARFFERWTPEGVWAIFWLNTILLMRMGSYLFGGVAIVFAFMILMTILSASSFGASSAIVMMTVFQYTGLLMSITFLQIWFSGAVKRSEAHKALPFPARCVVLMESLPVAIVLSVVLTLYYLVCLILSPQSVGVLTGHWAVSVSLSLPMCLVFLGMYLLNPDPGDYTQRVLTNMLMIPALLLVALPSAIVLLGGLALGLPFWAGSMVAVLVNAGIAWFLVCVAGGRYAVLNPAD